MLTRREFVGTCAATALAAHGMLPVDRTLAADGVPGLALFGAGTVGIEVARAAAAIAAQVVAVADPDFDRAAFAASALAREAQGGRLPLPRIAYSDEQLLTDSSVMGALIAAPVARRGAIARRALELGKSALIVGPPTAGDDLEQLARAAGAHAGRVRFMSSGADAESVQRFSSISAPRSLAVPRSARRVSIRCTIASSAEAQLALPPDLFAELVPAVAFLGSSIPTAVYAAEGRALGASGRVEATLHFQFRFGDGGVLSIIGQTGEARGPVPRSCVLFTQTLYVREDGQRFETVLSVVDGAERDETRLARGVDRYMRDLAGYSNPFANTLRDDLIAAYILRNARV